MIEENINPELKVKLTIKDIINHFKPSHIKMLLIIKKKQMVFLIQKCVKFMKKNYITQ